jgi:NADP-dependent 3-hydroxy acid dehydrogenase YdfG
MKMVSRNQSVVVTGVSTGIGWGISKILLANGFQVYGSVRRQTDADRLADEFGGALIPLVMDVTDRESVNPGRSPSRGTAWFQYADGFGQ